MVSIPTVSQVREIIGREDTELWKYAVAASATLVIAKFGTQFVLDKMDQRRLRLARAKARIELDAKKARWYDRVLGQISAEESEHIVTQSFAELKSQLQSGTLTCKKVLQAFQYKAAVEDKRLNFVCEPIQEAEMLADQLDKVSAEERAEYPLFGFPISLKENYEIKGYNCNIGMSRKLGEISTDSHATFTALVDQGCVPFIRCNLPQSMLSLCCSNPIYGQTKNPHNLDREPGGSSGGDGCAVGCGACILGLGGDIGGSIRVPAAWCGCQAIKPTSGRISYKNFASAIPGQYAVRATAGPLARSVDVLVDYMRAVSNEVMFDIDPLVPRIEFNEDEFNSTHSLTIGYYETLDTVPACESYKRAVRETVQHLKANGHKVVPFKCGDEHTNLIMYLKAITGDAGSSLVSAMRNDETSVAITDVMRLASIPSIIKQLIYHLIRPFAPSHLSDIFTAGLGRTVQQWWRLNYDIRRYQDEVISSWREAKLDAIICPPMPVPAMPLAAPNRAVWNLLPYSCPYNILNFVAGIVTVSKVTAADLVKDEREYNILNFTLKILKQSLVGAEGLPIAVQVVTLPYREELCLRVMSEIEKSAK